MGNVQNVDFLVSVLAIELGSFLPLTVTFFF